MHPDTARHLHEQRLRDGRRHWPVPDRLAAPAPRTRTLRRAIGRAIVRLGTAIEAAPSQPVASS